MYSFILDCILVCVCVCVCVYVSEYLLRCYDNFVTLLTLFMSWLSSGSPSIGSSLLFSFIANSIEIFLPHFITS